MSDPEIPDRQVPHPGKDAKRSLPKRFYKKVEVVAGEGGYGVLLDGRPLKTPSRQPLVVASERLAAALAAEWDRQASVIDIPSMWLTKIVNTSLDRVAAHRDAVIGEIAGFGATDLLCYRADHPDELVRRQHAAWQPIVDWAEALLGARIAVTQGVAHVAQPEALLSALVAHLNGMSDLDLTALHTLTTLTGSVFLALAVQAGRLTGAQAFAAAHIDEAWQAEVWGVDAEAEKRLAGRQAEFDAAAGLLALIGDATST